VNTTDKINDMDFFSKLRYTIKGPNSLGGKNDNRISKKYRDIHPSYIGKLDINVCGNSTGLEHYRVTYDENFFNCREISYSLKLPNYIGNNIVA